MSFACLCRVICRYPSLYLSMILGLGGVYVLISSFHDDDDDDGDDGEKFIYNLEYTNLAR